MPSKSGYSSLHLWKTAVIHLFCLSVLVGCQAISPIADLQHSFSSSGITIEPRLLDLGRVARYTRPKGTVRVVNHGKRPVQISWLPPSCSCTAAKLTKKLLEPNQSVPIAISLNTDRGTGKATNSVIVHFVEEIPNVDIPVVANVYEEIGIEPSEINLNPMKWGQPLTTEVKLKRSDGHPLPLPAIKIDSSEVTVLPVRTGPSAITLKVTAHPGIWAGIHHGTIALDTGISEIPSIKVPVTMNLLGKYAIHPLPINFGIVDGRAHATATIGGADPKRHLSIISSPAWAQGHLDQQRKPPVLSVDFVPPPKKREILEGNIVLNTNDPEEPRLKIPVMAALKGQCISV
jgi:hypothetical protein